MHLRNRMSWRAGQSRQSAIGAHGSQRGRARRRNRRGWTGRRRRWHLAGRWRRGRRRWTLWRQGRGGLFDRRRWGRGLVGGRRGFVRRRGWWRRLVDRRRGLLDRRRRRRRLVGWRRGFVGRRGRGRVTGRRWRARSSKGTTRGEWGACDRRLLAGDLMSMLPALRSV